MASIHSRIWLNQAITPGPFEPADSLTSPRSSDFRASPCRLRGAIDLAATVLS